MPWFLQTLGPPQLLLTQAVIPTLHCVGFFLSHMELLCACLYRIAPHSFQTVASDMWMSFNSAPASELLTNLFAWSPAGCGSDKRLETWAATWASPGGAQAAARQVTLIP